MDRFKCINANGRNDNIRKAFIVLIGTFISELIKCNNVFLLRQKTNTFYLLCELLVSERENVFSRIQEMFYRSR